ncbi:hypothetical protein HN51_028122 [Arachis hypogaea]|nr:Protein tesmin/TSO1-like CXC [Arachis hypogaea]
MASLGSSPGGGNKKRKRSSSNNGDNNGSCCNCRRIQCMNLFCVCLRAGDFCNDSCSCNWCLNIWENKDFVDEKKKEIELRDPHAFQPKIIFGENETAAWHRKGCNCRKSKCKSKYCACFRAEVGCSSRCRCEGCMNKYGNGIIKDEQEQCVLTNNNNGGNDVTVDNESSSSQSHHPVADNDIFDQLSELDVDMVINEEDEAECYRQQMLLAGYGENEIYNDNMDMASNQVNHVPAAASYYNYNVAAHNYHQPLTPEQIFRVENNTTEEQNTDICMLLDDPDLQGPSPFSFYDNNIVDESSSVHNFSMMEPIIQSSIQRYKPQSKSYSDLFQQEASSSGGMNHRQHPSLLMNAQHQRQNDATNIQAHSY